MEYGGDDMAERMPILHNLKFWSTFAFRRLKISMMRVPQSERILFKNCFVSEIQGSKLRKTLKFYINTV